MIASCAIKKLFGKNFPKEGHFEIMGDNLNFPM
jgi:hypothetical protein